MMVQADKAPLNKLLITGLGRSGTSAVASAVRSLGYHMPFASKMANNEDFTLRALLEQQDYQGIKLELEARCKTNPLVAWKDPKLFGGIGEKLLEVLDDDWAYLIVFRDPLSVGLRNVKSGGGDLDTALLQAVKNQGKLANFYLKAKQSRRVLLVSYEKLATNFDETIAEITGFLGFKYNKDDIDSLRKSMSADHTRYLQAQPGER